MPLNSFAPFLFYFSSLTYAVLLGSQLYLRSQFQATKSEAFNFNYWSNDDAPSFMMRSQVLSSKWSRKYVTPVAPKTGIELADGSGECERITILNLRSNYTRLKNVAALTLLGMSVFGGLVLIKGKDPKNLRKQA